MKAILSFFVGFMLCYWFFISCVLPDTKYFDGEGNALPDLAVKALVKSQFVIVGKEDSIILKQYFPEQ